MSCEVIREERGVWWKFSGVVTTGELSRISNSFYGDPKFDNTRYVLADFSQMKSLEFDKEDVEIIAAMDIAASISNPSLKIAIVKSSLDEAEKLASFYISQSPFEAKLFENIQDARLWIDEQF